jgi:6-phosphogluconolactonase
MTHDLRVCDDVDDLSRRAAEAVTAAIDDAVSRHGRCSIALAGGNTPRPIYRLLASQFKEQIPWSDVHVFWGDERFVPSGDPRRNETMVREALLDHVRCPPSNVHAVPAASTAGEAAAQYEAVLRQHFGNGWPRFDLVLLGLGEDAHTASLFPRSAALREKKRWVVEVTVPAEPPVRVTLTLPVFNHAALTYFVVTGSNKAPALHMALDGADPESYPAAGIRPAGGAIWWVDRDAVRALESTRRP